MCRLGASSEACTPHLTFQYEAMLVLYDINNSASVFINISQCMISFSQQGLNDWFSIWYHDLLFILLFQVIQSHWRYHLCFYRWNGWPSDSDLRGIWLACMTSAPQYQRADAGTNISKVSWVCQTCMITTPQSLCAAAGKSTYVTYNVSWTCRPCIFILKVYVKNVL